MFFFLVLKHFFKILKIQNIYFFILLNIFCFYFLFLQKLQQFRTMMTLWDLIMIRVCILFSVLSYLNILFGNIFFNRRFNRIYKSSHIIVRDQLLRIFSTVTWLFKIFLMSLIVLNFFFLWKKLWLFCFFLIYYFFLWQFYIQYFYVRLHIRWREY